MAGEGRAIGRVLLAAAASVGLSGCTLSSPPPRAGAGDGAALTGASAAAQAQGPSPAPPAVRTALLAGSSPHVDGPGAYRFQVEYPQLEGLGGRAQGVDAVIQAAMQRAVDDFVDTALSRSGASARSELDCRSRTVRTTVRLAVLRVDCTETDAGAARASRAVYTFDCDLAAARLLALQDLFRTGSAYLGTIADESRRQLGRLGAGDDATLADVTAPAVASFRAFLLQPGALGIVFARSALAAGGDPPEVSIPYSALARYLAPGVQDLAA